MDHNSYFIMNHNRYLSLGWIFVHVYGDIHTDDEIKVYNELDNFSAIYHPSELTPISAEDYNYISEAADSEIELTRVEEIFKKYKING